MLYFPINKIPSEKSSNFVFKKYQKNCTAHGKNDGTNGRDFNHILSNQVQHDEQNHEYHS